MLKFNGKEVVKTKEKEKDTKFVDEAYEEDLTEETLKEYSEIAKKRLEETTPEDVNEELLNRLQQAIETAVTYDELKEHYIDMQEEADKRDGGADKTNPDYYRTRDMESIDIMEIKHGTKAVMAFCILNSERYEYRVGNKRVQKGNAELDLEKADWYLNKYVELSKKIGTEDEVLGISSIITG